MNFDIHKKLNYFYENRKIPHILFHGTILYEKERVASQFIHKIYQLDKQQLKFNVLAVNCCGKGIKFIRDEIKTFAKLHMFQNHVPVSFKTILLLNTDFITEDAQSALRRSIELFSYNTRFFIIVENKNKLLKPILSRFCEIYVGKENVLQIKSSLTNTLSLEIWKEKTPEEWMEMVDDLIEKGYCAYHLIQSIQNDSSISKTQKIYTQFLFYKWKLHYRCEKLFMLTLLDFVFFRSYIDLKNICLL